MSLIGIDIDDYEDCMILHKQYGIELFQIAAKRVNAELLDNRVVATNDKLFKIVVHYSYSINLAHAWNSRDWWIQQLIAEIKYANKIRAFAIIIHTGKSLNYSISTAINNMYSSLLYVHEQTKDLNNSDTNATIRILIETPAGQGTELFSAIGDFTNFMKKFEHSEELNDRFGICIDTCHIFAAGYNIAEKECIASFFKTIDNSIGLNKIKLIHLNNARSNLGSKVDRHANLDKGVISSEAINMIVAFINYLEIPMVLETPTGDNYKDILNDYQIVKDFITTNSSD